MSRRSYSKWLLWVIPILLVLQLVPGAMPAQAQLDGGGIPHHHLLGTRCLLRRDNYTLADGWGDS